MSFAFTQAEILAEIERRENQQAEQPASNVESATALVSGMPGRIGSAMDQRKQEMVEVMNPSPKEGFQFPGEQAIQMFGKAVAGPVMDVTGEVITTGVGAAADMYDPEIRQGFNDLMQGIVDSDFAQQAIGYYQSLDAGKRRTIESLFNIGNILSPFKVKAKEGSGLTAAIEGGLTLTSKSKELKRSMLHRMFQPARSKENIEFEIKNGTEATDNMVETLLDVKGVSPLYEPRRNFVALNKDMNATEARLQGQLSSFDKTGKFIKSTRNSFGEMLANTINNSKTFVQKGLKPQEVQAAQAAIMRKVDGILTVLNKEGTPPNSLRGLLELRRRLDNEISDKEWAKKSDSEKASLTREKILVKDMRGELNKTISAFAEQFAPENETIKKLLKRQSALYQASENYASKSSINMANVTEQGVISSVFSSHPWLVYRSLQSQGTSPALAFVLAAPAAANAVGELAGAARRQTTGVQTPMIRGGMFYGQEEEQR